MNDRRILFLLPAMVALVVSACGGGGGGNRSAAPGRVQFEAGAVSIDEGAGTATVRITRSDGSDVSVSRLAEYPMRRTKASRLWERGVREGGWKMEDGGLRMEDSVSCAHAAVTP